jgi:hypothetical protein
MKVLKILSRRWLKIGYEQRTEIWHVEGTPHSQDIQIKAAYNCHGDYIGDYKMARFLFRRGITQVFKTDPLHYVCSIGFNLVNQKWYGWSHRAICGFGIGDKIFEENFGNDQTPFIKHGRKVIKTLADAKQAAINFAKYVS